MQTSHGGQALSAACLLERLPVVTPEDPQWEQDYRKWQRNILQKYQKDLSTAIQSTQVAGESERQVWQPAARETDAAEASDITSLGRSLSRRLFLVLKETGSPGWRLPSSPHRGGETMRQAAERALEEAVTGAPAVKTFFVGNAPCAHYTSASQKIFIHKAQLIKGSLVPLPGSKFFCPEFERLWQLQMKEMLTAEQVLESLNGLKSSRVEVSRQAAEILRLLSEDPEAFKAHCDRFGAEVAVSPLLVAAFSRDKITAETSLVSIINLSQETSFCQHCLARKTVSTALDRLSDANSTSVALLVKLLANLTRTAEGVGQLLTPTSDKWLRLAGRAQESAARDAYSHVADVLTNATSISAARRALLQSDLQFIAAVAQQLESDDLVRRRGYSQAFRNLALGAQHKDFQRASMMQADGLIEEMLACPTALSDILSALCGTKRIREAEKGVRVALAQAIWILVQDRKGFACLWDLGAPEKLRKAYENEEDEDVCEAMEGIAEKFISQAED